MFKRIVAAVTSPAGAVENAARLVAANSAGSLETFQLPDRPGDVLDDLLARVVDSGADLLVVGAHRHVIARRAAMLAPASVLMIPEGSQLDLSKIVVPVDFSASSAHALRCAMDLTDNGGSITALAVECDDDPWLDWASDHGRIQQHLIEFVEGVVPGAGVSCVVEPLNHSATILRNDGLLPTRRIEGADIATTLVGSVERIGGSLIVMGTRGRTRSASLLLGSVTEQVMQLARGPVLALKNTNAPMNLGEAILSRLRENTPALVAN